MEHDHRVHQIAEWGGWVLAAVLGLGFMVREWPHGPPRDAFTATSPAAQALQIGSPRLTADDGPDPLYPQKVQAPIEEMPDQF